jgi:histidyl-tRNA synthetase
MTKIPPTFAPLLGSIAAVRTGIAKYRHIYEPIGLEHHLLNLSSGVSYIVRLLGAPKPDLDRARLPLLLAEAIRNFYETTFSELLGRKEAALPARRQLPFGLVTKVFLTFVKAEGIIALAKLPVFVAPEGKRGSIPQPPTGCRDLEPADMRLRGQVLDAMTAIFKRHGAVQIETPVFEAREVLIAKYGEEAKLIYNLEDQGGELLSLRYDLTVPFARYVATHGVSAIKRYQIAKVYRRDKPQPEQGRYREFYQFDFDIAGPSGLMIADAEIVQIMVELLMVAGTFAPLDFAVQVSHRKLLAILVDVAGVATEKFQAVCSSVDKLDKRPWSEVRAELIDIKGIRPESADKLYEYIQLNGEPISVLATVRERLQTDCPSTFARDIQPVLDEMALLFDYLRAFGVLERVRFNISLARGLDYYTGVIFEAIVLGGPRVGSIAGGGRYDDLVGQFANRKVPAVGMSIGIERIIANIEQSIPEKPREVDTDVFVCSIAENYTKERMELLAELWANGIAAEFTYKDKPNVKDQFARASAIGAKLVVTVAPDEVAAGTLRIKILAENREIVIPRGELIATVKSLLA